ncbi:MAG: hypothetical protein D6720_05630 [Gammaproteobacteria bacterium]|nr:MAG: hypothetical protein D6720_05630 [Gammaproteobacteria bacterium]
MKKLLIAGLIGLTSTAALADNDSLYREGNYSFLDEQESTIARTVAPSDPVALENLYREGNFPIVDHTVPSEDTVVDSIVPDSLYVEGNYSV